MCVCLYKTNCSPEDEGNGGQGGTDSEVMVLYYVAHDDNTCLLSLCLVGRAFLVTVPSQRHLGWVPLEQSSNLSPNDLSAANSSHLLGNC